MNQFSEEQKKALSAKLDPTHVKNREQGGKSLSYIEGWQVIAEANRIFGFDGWHRETILLQETNRDLVTLRGRNNQTYEQWRIGYIAKVRVTVGSIIREGTGYGSGMGKPEAIGDAVEGAIKEAETDAMKRALMTFGNPFGLALYDKSQANVGTDEPEGVSEPRNDGGYHTKGGNRRKPGPRMADASDIDLAMEQLLTHVGDHETAGALKTWAAKQAEVIQSLPDQAYDEFYAAFRKELSRLKGEKEAA